MKYKHVTILFKYGMPPEGFAQEIQTKVSRVYGVKSVPHYSYKYEIGKLIITPGDKEYPLLTNLGNMGFKVISVNKDKDTKEILLAKRVWL